MVAIVHTVRYVLGRDTRELAVLAEDSDDAFDLARAWLRKQGFVSASIQGKARPGSPAGAHEVVS